MISFIRKFFNKKQRGFEKISKKQFDNDCIENFLLLNYNNIKLPQRATSKSAGYDCYSLLNFILIPNQEIKLPTGIKAYMKNYNVLKAYPRSGLGFKYYTRLANTIGIIDADFYNNPNNEGHIWIKLRNESDKTLSIKEGEAICQFIFERYDLADNDNFTGIERIGGFGSSGK
jgi:dUTP pyrophosphatase